MLSNSLLFKASHACMLITSATVSSGAALS
jgi:hypothetical protein